MRGLALLVLLCVPTSLFAQVVVQIDRAAPAAHAAGRSSAVTFHGFGFTAGTTVTIAGRSVRGVLVVDEQTMTGTLPPTLPTGTHSVYVRRPDDAEAVLVDGVGIEPARFPPVEGLACARSATEVAADLSWSNPIRYDRLHVYQGDTRVATLDGDATSYRHTWVSPVFDPERILPFSIVGVVELEEGGGTVDSESYPATCNAAVPRQTPLFVEFGTFRPGASNMMLRGPTDGASEGNEVQTVFRLREPQSGVRLRVHGKRLDPQARLRARIRPLSSPGTVLWDDFVGNPRVSLRAAWINGTCQRSLPAGQYLLGFYAVGAGGTGATAFSLSSDATRTGHARACGPYPLTKVAPLVTRETSVQIRDLSALALHPLTAQLAADGVVAGGDDEATANAAVLSLLVDDPDHSILSYHWEFSDGSEAVTASRALEHTFGRAGVFHAQVTAHDADGPARSSIFDQIVIGEPLPDEVIALFSGPPTELSMLAASASLDETPLVAGHTRGRTIAFLCSAVAGEGKQIESVTLEVRPRFGDTRQSVTEDFVFNFELESGLMMGIAGPTVELERYTAQRIVVTAVFTDSRGLTASISQNIDLCGIPAPLEESWLTTTVTGNRVQGFEVEGVFPRRRPLWSYPIDLPLVGTLDNRLDAYFGARARFEDGKWFAERLEGGLEAELLDIDVVDGKDFFVAIPDGQRRGEPCDEFNVRYNVRDRLLFNGSKVCVNLFSGTVWSFGLGPISAAEVTAEIDACVEFDVRADIDVRVSHRSPDVDVTLRPGILGELPVQGEASALWGLASATLRLTPALTFELPIELDYRPVRNELDIDTDWCLRASLFGYARACFGWGVWCPSTSALIFEEEWGDCPHGIVAGLDDLPEPVQDRAPALASSPSGESSLMVYVENASADEAEAEPVLFYRSRRGDGAYSPPQPLFSAESRAFVKDPSVAFLDEDFAIAVWTQSRLRRQEFPPLADGAEGVVALNRILGSNEILLSFWDGSRWTDPEALTNNSVSDGSAAVTRVDRETAAVVWVAAEVESIVMANGRVRLEGLSTRAAFVDLSGEVFDVTTLSAGGPPAADIDPAVSFSPTDGTGIAVWVRDTDGDISTHADRFFAYSRFGGGSWRAPRQLSTAPEVVGPLQPTVALAANDRGVIGGVAPSRSTPGVPALDADGRVFVVELSESGFSDARFLAAPAAPAAHWACTFEDGVRGVDPAVAFVDAQTAVVAFRSLVGLDVEADPRPNVDLLLGLAAFDFGAPDFGWSPVLPMGLPPDAFPVDLAVSPMASNEVELAVADGDQPVGAILVAPVAPDLVVEEVLLGDPHVAPGSFVQAGIILRNVGLRAVDATSLEVSVELVQGDDVRTIASVDVDLHVPAGGSARVNLPFAVPDEPGRVRVVVEETADESSDENNSRAIDLGVSAPRDLECTDASDGGHPVIRVTWTNTDAYDSVQVLRDGLTIVSIDGSRTSFLDRHATPGVHEWTVRGLFGTVPSRPATRRCELDVPEPGATGDGEFVRGDANADGRTDLSDAVATLAALFLGGAAPPCVSAADSNDDGAVNVSDPSFTLNFLFLGGPAIPAPTAGCGTDPTADGLSCDSYPPCSP